MKKSFFVPVMLISMTLISACSTSNNTPPTPVVENGWIEGSMSYPSEGIPDDVVVCADNLVTQLTLCTDKRIIDNGIRYKLEVPPGEYYVYSKGGIPDYKAYYSEFVTCGVRVECPSHEPIRVTVQAGKTVSEIDPGDWYL